MGDTAAEVVVVRPTVMDGTVVCWYRSLAVAENRGEYLSASRNRVCIETKVHSAEEQAALVAAIETAVKVMERLRRGDNCAELATHKRDGMFGPLVEAVKSR